MSVHYLLEFNKVSWVVLVHYHYFASACFSRPITERQTHTIPSSTQAVSLTITKGPQITIFM